MEFKLKKQLKKAYFISNGSQLFKPSKKFFQKTQREILGNNFYMIPKEFKFRYFQDEENYEDTITQSYLRLNFEYDMYKKKILKDINMQFANEIAKVCSLKLLNFRKIQP